LKYQTLKSFTIYDLNGNVPDLETRSVLASNGLLHEFYLGMLQGFVGQ